jgi:cysteinyl-tRNA synthetase
MRLTNTLTGSKDEFFPLEDGVVRMYNCGPTVYDYAHIGNLRAYVLADLLRRSFEEREFTVDQRINVTDVGHLTDDGDNGEDKMEKGAKRDGASVDDIVARYTSAFVSDLAFLNIEAAHEYPQHFPRATQHINEQIDLIKVLEEKGATYVTSDGVYFDTAAFPEYGKLGGIDIAGLMAGARVEMSDEKRNLTDFALWKFSPAGSSRLQEWDSPWGRGFPGWHVECSAMAMKYLGETLDIHTGGVDHIPVHHNNEIAQSETATGKPFARFWVHSAFLTVDGKKMAKSDGNTYRLTDLMERGFHPLSYRYWLTQAHYSTQANFTWDAMEAAQTGFDGLLRRVIAVGAERTEERGPEGKELLDIMEDDLNAPAALARLHEILADADKASASRAVSAADRLLGLSILSLAAALRTLPPEIEAITRERTAARDAKDWNASDRLRGELEKAGIAVSDTPEGTQYLRTLGSLLS